MRCSNFINALFRMVGAVRLTKAQIGGLCVIEVPDAHAALAWAERAPFEHYDVVEVRPTRVVPSA